MMPGQIVRKTITKETHDSHPNHELELKNYRKPYRCDGCLEHGYGPRYRCDLCDFDLHEECMFTTHTTSHEFFKGSTFKFFNRPPGRCCECNRDDDKRYCDACGQAINGFVYHCEEKGWDLHPCCRHLKDKIDIDGVEFRLCNKVSQKCLWCKKRKLPNCVKGIPGWSHLAKSDNCHFHVYCVTEMVLESWKNGPKDSNCLALENLKLELPLQANLFRRRGRGSKYLRMVKFLGTILAILLGDPTITLACLFVELVSK
ncbi:hypothetical protein I3843_01G277900 [Carya illinoinensis]|nr:hypothetical protein I3843_01G277900 [Carya illinoinensis]